ncbi:MAG TPA: metal-dependent transcriptional regulator [Lentisphaeria bacterium]|nr:metal-dependent transcriptional regulator [Lentisphaerota bacterium]HPY89911.1 metal-dependent transcriptional regulator [Lentisphaeria bacterium]HQC52563.1 metal-dependent transcriptional regulator [Lentisphaeria bacterium]HQL88669.1 metal-dependent transcriptional regulator [Lentisphaeria bacterium]
MDNTVISSTLEDYLEAIAALVEINGHAHTKDIAERLNVSMSTVSSALQTLSSRSLITYQPHMPVLLTARGAERAAVIRNRHAALRDFFQNILKAPYQEADAAACRVEHALNDEMMSKLVLLAEAISTRDDCRQLRAYLSRVMPELRTESTTGAPLVALSELQEGQRGIVVKVDDNLRGIKKFADLGLVRGSLLQMEGHAPFGDLLRIKVMSSSLSLRRQDAAHIWVRLTDNPADSMNTSPQGSR